MTLRTVVVDVATVWTAPDAPRAVDAPAVADVPDLDAWTQTLDAETRLGLHGRTLTQLVRDEPVEVVASGPPGWAKVAALWQPTPDDPRGYPGWIRAAHRQPDGVEGLGGANTMPARSDGVAAEPLAILEQARRFIGLAYLWGGTSPWGFDCSGLVHYCHRLSGVVVPRDAAAQQLAAEPVPLGNERPGDLYFFASAGRVHHVGFVTGSGRMLHAPEDSDVGPGEGRIEEVALSADRRASLVAAGRLV